MHPHLIQFEPDETTRAAQRQVKVWVREALGLTEEAVVTVTESRCADPSCPLLEMLIVVHDGENVRSFQLARPKAAVTRMHVLQALS